MQEMTNEKEQMYGSPPFPLNKNPKLSEALAKFQAKYCNAAKDGSGRFGSYVTLTEAELAVSPATEFGLSHTFIMKGCSETMAYVGIKLMHVSGEYEFSELPIFFNTQRPIVDETTGRTIHGGKNPYHEIGSGVTYIRRYLLLAAYGLGQADDEADTFSREAQDNTGNVKQEKPRPWKKPELVKVDGFPEEEQPLTEERRNLAIGLVKEFSTEDRSKFVIDFCKEFKLPSGTKVQKEITAVKHEMFIASWKP